MNRLTENWRMNIAENLPCILDPDGKICDLTCDICGDRTNFYSHGNRFYVYGHHCGGDYQLTERATPK